MDRDNLSDYRRKILATAKGAVGIVSDVTGIGQVSWVDDTGKRHFHRPHPVATIPPPIPPVPTVPPTDTSTLWGRVLTDVEVFGKCRILVWEQERGAPVVDKNGKLIQGVPETVKAADSELLPMSREMQFYWFDLLRLYAGTEGYTEDVVNLFRVVTRSNAFKTNGQNGANFVTKTNLDQSPLKTEVIVTGNAWLKILDNGAIYNYRGRPNYKFATMDYHKFVRPVISFSKYNTDKFYFATSVRRDGSTIPLLGGIDIPTPNFGVKDWHYIDVSRVQLQPLGSSPTNPYVYMSK